MSTQSKKPDALTSDFSETISSLDELFPLNEYKIESDTLSDQRSSTEPEPLQNGRVRDAIAGQWGETVEFVGCDPNDYYQTIPDTMTRDLILAGGANLHYLLSVLQNRFARFEPTADIKRELAERYDADYSDVTFAYKPLSYKAIVEQYRGAFSKSKIERDLKKLALLTDSKGDPFVIVIPQGKWSKDTYGKRDQDGNVYVLNKVRLPEDYKQKSKTKTPIVQSAQSTRFIDQMTWQPTTSIPGSSETQNYVPVLVDPPSDLTTPPSQIRVDPLVKSDYLIPITKDLSKNFTQHTSELARTLGGDEGSTKRTDVTSNQLSTFSDLTPAQQNLILGAFNVDRPQMLTKAQMTRGLTFTFAKPTDPVDDEFRELATKGKQERAEKKRAEAEFLRQEREKQQAIEAENAEIARYGHVLTEVERQEQIESQRANTLAYGKKLMTEFRESCKPKINTPQT